MVRIVPLAELSNAEIRTIRDANAEVVMKTLVDSSIVGSTGQSIVRDWYPLQASSTAGTGALATGGGGINDSIYYGGNDGVAGDFVSTQSNAFEVASAQITVDTHIDVIASQTLPNDMALTFFGFWDLTSNPDAASMRWRRGIDILDLWHVEQCYIYGADSPMGGMIRGALLYEPNDNIRVEAMFKTAANKNFGLFAYVSERAGDQISK